MVASSKQTRDETMDLDRSGNIKIFHLKCSSECRAAAAVPFTPNSAEHSAVSAVKTQSFLYLNASSSAVHGATLWSEKSNFAVKYHQQQSRATPPTAAATATATTASIATAPLLTTKVLLIPWPRPNKIFLEGE